MPSPASGRTPGVTPTPDVERLLRAHLRDPVAPSSPRPSTTVALLRTNETGEVEVLVMLRAPGLAFAGGHVAFPGGKVDPDDASVPVVPGPDLEDWATRLDVTPVKARALAVCAARELFEETQTLLASRGADPLPASDISELPRLRQALLAGSTTFEEVLAAVTGKVAPELMVPWSRWITPSWSARRYDTLVLIAVLPRDAAPALDGGGEATRVEWHRPHDLLRWAEAGSLQMFSPTAYTLRDLGELDAGGLNALKGRRSPLPAHEFTYAVTPREGGEHVTITVRTPDGVEPVTNFAL